jgi:hypothetical protein
MIEAAATATSIPCQFGHKRLKKKMSAADPAPIATAGGLSVGSANAKAASLGMGVNLISAMAGVTVRNDEITYGAWDKPGRLQTAMCQLQHDGRELFNGHSQQGISLGDQPLERAFLHSRPRTVALERMTLSVPRSGTSILTGQNESPIPCARHVPGRFGSLRNRLKLLGRARDGLAPA